MRPTWIVLGLVVGGGAVGYARLRGDAEARREGSTPSLDRRQAEVPPPDAPPAPAVAGRDARARELLEAMARARAAPDEARYLELERALREEAWDSAPARRHAVHQGWNLRQRAEAAEGLERIRIVDRARRLLSRGLLLPDFFEPSGAPTPVRERLVRTIQDMNQTVMRWTAGLEGVTRPHTVAAGEAPVQIVSRQRIPGGPNVLLMWNKAGNLDPGRLRAGETLLVPVEELTVVVSLERRRLLLFVGDWFVKEFRVGVGAPDTPTPRGTFRVESKQENPPWWPPGGRMVPAGDPRNELGAAWIAITNEHHPTGYGIHGTNAPESVGEACSKGCVRLTNEEAREVLAWVRTGSAGGKATAVRIE